MATAPREEVAAAKAREIAADEGLALLHPFDDPEIVAGQAGAGLEALDQLAAKGAMPTCCSARSAAAG